MWDLLGFKKTLPNRNEICFYFHFIMENVHVSYLLLMKTCGGKRGFLKGDHNQNFRMVLLDKVELLKKVKQSF